MAPSCVPSVALVASPPTRSTLARRVLLGQCLHLVHPRAPSAVRGPPVARSLQSHRSKLFHALHAVRACGRLQGPARAHRCVHVDMLQRQLASTRGLQNGSLHLPLPRFSPVRRWQLQRRRGYNQPLSSVVRRVRCWVVLVAGVGCMHAGEHARGEAVRLRQRCSPMCSLYDALRPPAPSVLRAPLAPPLAQRRR